MEDTLITLDEFREKIGGKCSEEDLQNKHIEFNEFELSLGMEETVHEVFATLQRIQLMDFKKRRKIEDLKSELLNEQK